MIKLKILIFVLTFTLGSIPFWVLYAQVYSANGIECEVVEGASVCHGRLCHDKVYFNPLYVNQFFCVSEIDGVSMTYDPLTGCLCQVLIPSEEKKKIKDVSRFCRFRDGKTVGWFSGNGEMILAPLNTNYTQNEFCKTGKIWKPKDTREKEFQKSLSGYFQNTLDERDELVNKHKNDYQEHVKKMTEEWNRIYSEILKKKETSEK